MNVGFVAPRISGGRGGIESVSYSLARVFPSYENFHAYCASDTDNLEEEIIPNVYYSSRKKGVGLHLDLIKKLFKDHGTSAFDFTFSSHYAYSIPCFLLKKFKKVPYGILVHGTELQEKQERSSALGDLAFAIKKLVRKELIKSADVIFANSNFTKGLVEAKYGRFNKQIVVIHPPVQYIDKNIKIGEKAKTYKLLSVGRLVERKGFQYVIDALRNLIVDIPELKYYIAGSGPYLDALKDRADKNGVTDHVVFLGRVSEEEKDRLYRECDYFLMPSYMIKDTEDFEGFGIVYIEANMYGKYVIATRSGGIPDAVCDGVTGSFVESQDPESIYLKLKELYSAEYHVDENKCIEWSKTMDVNNIVLQYIEAIADVTKLH